jgi:hypothetical protein
MQSVREPVARWPVAAPMALPSYSTCSLLNGLQNNFLLMIACIESAQFSLSAHGNNAQLRVCIYSRDFRSKPLPNTACPQVTFISRANGAQRRRCGSRRACYLTCAGRRRASRPIADGRVSLGNSSFARLSPR